METNNRASRGLHRRRFLEEITVVGVHAGFIPLPPYADHRPPQEGLVPDNVQRSLTTRRYVPRLIFCGTESHTVNIAQQCAPEGTPMRQMPGLNVRMGPEGGATREEALSTLRIAERMACDPKATLRNYLEEPGSEHLRTYSANVLRTISRRTRAWAKRHGIHAKDICILIVSEAPLAAMMIYDLVPDREGFARIKPDNFWACVLHRGSPYLIFTSPV